MNSAIVRVNDAEAPEPLGHYVQATKTPDGQVWISAQLPLGANLTKESPVKDQARQAIGNVLAIARRAGCAAEDILKVTVYLRDVAAWSEVNEEFALQFGSARPARSVIEVGGVHHGYALAVDAVAHERR
ncbi:RidA family protein [Actinosynnema sp. CS-041913]|uniref:RidA family protein n=1 Tax=Actinosynnema sp. CS-041913 TaxID=3239917 RepID=UPI003D8FB54E